MAGRTMPTECPHSVVSDWGDFGPDPHDSSVGTEGCPECDEELIAEIVRVNTDIGRERRLAMHYAKHFPAEAVAQLVADGVLVEQATKGPLYRLVLPEEG